MTAKKNPHIYTIPAVDLGRLLRPVLPFAEATRYSLPVLNAVHLTSADGYLVARATDRYVAAFQRVAVEGAKPGLSFTLPIPSAKAMLAAFKPARKAMPDLTLTFTAGPVPDVQVQASGGFALMDAANMSWLGEVGAYPHIAKILTSAIEKAAPSDGVALNPALLSKFATARAEQKENHEPLRMRMAGETGSIAVAIGDDFLGVVQPQRGGATEFAVWSDCITEAPEKKKAAA